MKPGTKSRKLGLEIPTVNPCNDFIVDYLIRNKIKSEKQVLCKSFLYNLAIEAVRKYPLPLICEEQLAALEGFGNFFIGQVGRLIKKHYNRGRLPTQKQMEQDDEAHFEALRAKNKPNQEKMQGLDSPVFRSSKQSEEKKKSYRPKKNTQPFNILEALIQLKADERAVTKGDINEILFNKGKEKIRLWYMLRQRLQEQAFILLDSKNEDYIYLTPKGRKYVENYDKQQQQKTIKGRRKAKPDEENDQNSLDSSAYNEQEEKTISKSKSQSKKVETITKTESKVEKEIKPTRVFAEMELKKLPLPKNAKYQTLSILLNQKDLDTAEMQAFFDKYEDITYEITEMELANFLFSTDQKILDYIVIRILGQDFDQENFKTMCFRAFMTTCENIYFVIQEEKLLAQFKLQQPSENKKEAEEHVNDSQNSKQEQRERRNLLLCSAIASGFHVVRTENLKQTLKFIVEVRKTIASKLEQSENQKSKKSRKDKPVPQRQEMKYLGNLQRINKKVSAPYEISTITTEILRCVPELNLKCIKTLQEKLPTLAYMYKKIQNSGSTKQKRLFLRSYLIDEKVNDEALNSLVQILFYESY